MFQYESDEPANVLVNLVLMVDFSVFFHFAYPKKPIFAQVALNIPISACQREKQNREHGFTQDLEVVGNDLLCFFCFLDL